jgi:DNA-binding winged helix-turn-helix (wHTH) protein
LHGVRPVSLFPAERQLLKGEAPVQIGSREFDNLIALVERAGEGVSKRELFAPTREYPHESFIR